MYSNRVRRVQFSLPRLQHVPMHMLKTVVRFLEGKFLFQTLMSARWAWMTVKFDVATLPEASSASVPQAANTTASPTLAQVGSSTTHSYRRSSICNLRPDRNVTQGALFACFKTKSVSSFSVDRHDVRINFVLDLAWHEEYNIEGTTKHQNLREALLDIVYESKYIKEHGFKNLVLTAR